MAPGEHTFEVRAMDMSEPPFENPNNPNQEGNVDPTPATYTWTSTADTTPPGTGILSGPANGSRVGLIDSEFEFFGTDNATPVLNLEFECKVDAGLWEPCESPGSAEGLEPGPHSFSVRAIDMALNVDPTPAVRTFTVVPMPLTTITSGPGQLNPEGVRVSKEDHATFAFRSDQPGTTFECSLDEGGVNPGETDGFFPCESPVAYFGLDDGEHTFEVRATNPEGVIEEPPALYEWFVELGPDTVAPNTTILTGPAASDPLSVATFTFTGSDNRVAPVTFECALDGQAYSSCTSPEEFSDLVRGTHVLLVRARDEAGNRDLTPARYEWVVQPPPVTTILSAPGGDHREHERQVHVPGRRPRLDLLVLARRRARGELQLAGGVHEPAARRAPLRRARPRAERRLGRAVDGVRVAGRRHDRAADVHRLRPGHRARERPRGVHLPLERGTASPSRARSTARTPSRARRRS